ncbi:MAG: hypothetical protein ACFFBD_21265 [Candidatus Hodarchaeota archaeon]
MGGYDIDKKNSSEKIQLDDTKLDNKVTINQLQRFLERYELDDDDLQLVSEFQTQKPVSQLNGKYKVFVRQFYRRAKKLDRNGLLKYILDGKTKHYFVTKQGQKIIDICFSGSEESADSVRNSSSSPNPLKKIVRTHAYFAEMPIHTKPKRLDTLLKRGSRTTGLKAHNMRNWIKHYGWMNFEGYEAYVEITTRNVFVRIKDILGTSADRW